MATLNPLEQKARSSFIKGFVIALIIGLLIAGGVGYLYMLKLQEEAARIKNQNDVLIVAKDIKSGDEIKADSFKSKTEKVDKSVVPKDAVSSYSQLLKNLQPEGSEIDTSTTKIIAKSDIYANTMITSSMVSLSTEVPTNDLRLEQYNMIALPVDLKAQDTVDIRLRLPTGQDYIVISKKNVTIPEVSGVPSSDTIQMKVTEDELLTMSAAIVDAYKVKGSKLYAVKYAEPGMQEKVVATYIPAAETLQLIATDPNIVQEAKNSLITFYNGNNETYRKGVAEAIQNVDSETQRSNVESATSSEASTQKSQRQQYLQSMQ
ncbi:MAG: hypothetical protein IKG14_03185 [Clostridia bacterium]|nr:hypothetical protein [Clostridia bacterium]